MQKRKLSILGVLLSFILYSCSEEMEIPQPTGETVPVKFGITDARHYFEENATDLAALRFKETVATKNPNQPILELSPDWKFAMQSGHSGVSLIEVPIRSNSYNIYTETVFKKGKKILNKCYETRRRLIIARRNTGETDMFVITLVPLPTAGGNVIKSMENFRYLGGGDFTGRVFCSTLDGKFVKAFGYTNGQLNGTLLVMKRSELEKHADEGWNQHYSSINLQEGVRTRAGTYVFDEGNGNPDVCIHGYKDGTCPICMDEVVVVACPYCHTQNGCICSKCFYCGKKESACTCMRCVKCRNKMQECTCYLYPDPEPNPKPEPNPNPGGGGGEVIPPPQPEPDPNPDPEDITILDDVDLTNQDNFVGYDISHDCMAGCRSIMANYGVATGSSANVYQLLYERNGVLEYHDTDNYTTVYDNAISCINRHLDADRPIIIGVNHTLNRDINEGATDHWIIIAGRGYDASQSMYYYIYMDTGRSSATAGCNVNDNRLYYDSDNYTFRDENAGARGSKQFDVTQVRPNDGQNLDETITQPTKPNN